MPRKTAISVTAGIVLGVFVVAPLFDRSLPYQRTGGRIAPPSPRGGDEVTAEYDVVVWKRCPGRAIRHVIDGAGIDHEYRPHEAMIQGQTRDDPVFRVRFTLPVVTAENNKRDWEYYADMEYWCNWTHRAWPLRDRTPSVRFRPTEPD